MISHRPKSGTVYVQADIFYTLHLIEINQSIGRYNLAKYLEISEAQTRAILQKLVAKKLIEKKNQRQGHQFSSYGSDIWKKSNEFIHIPKNRIHLGSKYTIGRKDAAVCLEASGIEHLNTVVLRDEALVNGALGCTVFLRETSGDIYLLDAIYPPLPKKPIKDLKVKTKLNRVILEVPWRKILVIVGTANSIIKAQIGAISAAILLVPEEINLLFKL